MSVAAWFSEFCSQLRVQNAPVISQRCQNITRCLNSTFWNTSSRTSHSLYVGSYGRSTAIAGFSDLDMVFQLPSSLYNQHDVHRGNGQSALLQRVRRAIVGTYSRTKVSGDGQVVLVPFLNQPQFEVVPVFLADDGSFIYPDANRGGSWKVTNPRPEIDAIRVRNAVCNQNLVLLCRMARAWKAKWNVPMGGLLVDTLAYQFLENWQFREKSYMYYGYMSRDFFAWMAMQRLSQKYWRAPGSGSFVYPKGYFQHKAKRCYNLAVQAIQYENSHLNRDRSAKLRWRAIYGTKFPI